MAKFSSNFWGSEFCSTAGFDTLVKRLKEGKRVCQDFEEYIEKRAKLEKEYGEGLMKLARAREWGKDEIGSLRKSWEELKTETESYGRVHLNLSQKLQEDVYRSLREFRDQQRDIRKKSEDTVKRAARHKQGCYERCNRLHSHYEGKCRDADKAEDGFNRSHSTPTTKPKDLAQAQRKMDTSRTAANNADTAYQEAVRNLEDSRQLWEREMEILCKQFQELEEQRTAFLRHQMWSYSNHLSQCTVQDDELCEKVRKVLEECDIDADIDLFVRDKATGSERPLSVPYINYYHPTSSDNFGVRPGTAAALSLPPPPGGVAGGGRASPSLYPPPPHKELPPIPPPDDPITSSELVYSSIPETLKMDHAALVEEGYYAAPKTMEKMIVLYNYEPQGDQELSLREGDVLTIIAKEDDVWWCGQFKGKVGMFPATYVEPYD